MDWFLEILKNHALISALSAWVIAQVVKTILYVSVNRKFNLSRLFGDGGMPSGHAASVTAFAVTCAMDYGFSSFAFAISTLLALIVMHDASGVRQQSGKQAQVLNQIMDFIHSMESGLAFENKLKELIGHTHLQVLAGSLLGLVVALLLR